MIMASLQRKGLDIYLLILNKEAILTNYLKMTYSPYATLQVHFHRDMHSTHKICLKVLLLGHYMF